MVEYKDAQNVVPHKFSNNVLKISNSNYEIIVNGLDSFAAAVQVDKTTWEAAGDGLGQFAIDPDRSAIFTFSAAEAMDSTNDLWDLYQTGDLFKLSFLDPAAPTFECTGPQCLFVKRPDILRDKAKPMVEWSVICGYATMRGGSFTLSTTV
jgi:hypothetical protein